MLTAIALDDEPMALEILRYYADRMPDEVKLQATFSSILDAKAFLETESVDLIFLDVRMPLLSGLEFYKMFGKDCLLVLTTAYADYALEGFKLNAVDYLLKPFDFKHFENAVQKAKTMLRIRALAPEDADTIFLRVDGHQVKIKTSQITYVEGMGDYLKIFLNTGKFLVTRQTIKTMEEQLRGDFLRIHKSYIVPTNQISVFSATEVKIGEKTLPVGQTYSKILLEAMLSLKTKKP